MAKKAVKKVEKKPAAKAAAKPAAKTAKVSAGKVAPKKIEKIEKAEKPAKIEKSAKTEKPVKMEKAAEGVRATPAPVAKGPVLSGKGTLKVETKKKIDKSNMSEDEAKWWDLHERHQGEKAQVYDMRSQFEAMKPLQHKVLGWGWVLSNENDRLEVLFKDGKKILISNYQR